MNADAQPLSGVPAVPAAVGPAAAITLAFGAAETCISVILLAVLTYYATAPAGVLHDLAPGYGWTAERVSLARLLLWLLASLTFLLGLVPAAGCLSFARGVRAGRLAMVDAARFLFMLQAVALSVIWLWGVGTALLRREFLAAAGHLLGWGLPLAALAVALRLLARARRAVVRRMVIDAVGGALPR